VPREATRAVPAQILNEIEKCVNCIAKKIQLRCDLSGSSDSQSKKFVTYIQKVLASLSVFRLLCSRLHGKGASSA
jgi:hypothetical protein